MHVHIYSLGRTPTARRRPTPEGAGRSGTSAPARMEEVLYYIT